MTGTPKRDLESPDQDAHFNAAIDWETSRVKHLERSERRAWMVAGSAIGLCLLLMGGMAMMLPLKEKEMGIIRENTTTGAIDVIGSLRDQRLDYDEVRDQYWMRQYVLARESYDWQTLQQDYNTVGLLSSPNVASQYSQQFKGDDALDKRFGANVTSRVEILSVVLNTRGVATVRFTKTTKRVDDGAAAGVTSTWVATIGYEYQGTSRMSSTNRMKNPFGLQVTSYRVDPELAGAGVAGAAR